MVSDGARVLPRVFVHKVKKKITSIYHESKQVQNLSILDQAAPGKKR